MNCIIIVRFLVHCNEFLEFIATFRFVFENRAIACLQMRTGVLCTYRGKLETSICQRYDSKVANQEPKGLSRVYYDGLSVTHMRNENLKLYHKYRRRSL